MAGLGQISGFTAIYNGKRQAEVYPHQSVDLLIGHLRVADGLLLEQGGDHAKGGIYAECIKVRVSLFPGIDQQEFPVIAGQVADDELMRRGCMFRVMLFSYGIGFLPVLLPGPVVVPAHSISCLLIFIITLFTFKNQGIWRYPITKMTSTN